MFALTPFLNLNLYVLEENLWISLRYFMQTKHLCVLFHFRTKGLVLLNLFKPCSKNSFPDRSKLVLLLWIIFVIYASCLSCFLVGSLHFVGTCLEMANLLVCLYVNFLCFVNFSCGSLGQAYILIYDLCLLTFFHLATQCVQSIPDDNTCEVFRQYMDKGKEQKVYRFGECCNQSNIVPQNSCYEF